MDSRTSEIRKNRSSIMERIAEAARRAGRDPAEVRLMAVTKTHSEATVRSALESGLTLFGENRVQEAVGKYDVRKYAGLTDRLELHLIGHLQRNKAKLAAGFFHWVQSIDKLETAAVLDKWAGESGRKVNILIEVNTSGEESKFGLRDENDLWPLAEGINGLGNLSLRGLMTIGPFTSEEKRIRSSFSRLRELYRRMKDSFPRLSCDTLSMGMSGDYELAIEEGSTLVRVGTALFGRRPE
jgi:pyridoxal phosphate enzyme (YggS family)